MVILLSRPKKAVRCFGKGDKTVWAAGSICGPDVGEAAAEMKPQTRCCRFCCLRVALSLIKDTTVECIDSDKLPLRSILRPPLHTGRSLTTLHPPTLLSPSYPFSIHGWLAASLLNKPWQPVSHFIPHGRCPSTERTLMRGSNKPPSDIGIYNIPLSSCVVTVLANPRGQRDDGRSVRPQEKTEKESFQRAQPAHKSTWLGHSKIHSVLIRVP